jgi:hypothetical protein
MQRIEPTMSPEHKELITAFKQGFDTESGGKILKDLKSYCMWMQPTFQKRGDAPADPLEMAFLEGRRDVITYILRNINLDLPTG